MKEKETKARTQDCACEPGTDCQSCLCSITLDMGDGTTNDYEILGFMEYGGKQYVALSELDTDEYDVLRVDESENGDGDNVLATIDDEEEYTAVADMFDDKFAMEGNEGNDLAAAMGLPGAEEARGPGDDAPNNSQAQ